MLATDKIQTVLVTTPVLHPLDSGGVKLAKIPLTGWDLDNPYYSCACYSSPKVVLKNQKHLKQEINLISVYGISVDSIHRDGITHLTVRTEAAKKPEGYKLTVGEVVELTVRAVREDFPDEKKYLIKVSDKSLKAEVGKQDAATAPKLKPEGKEKAKSKSKERSR